LRAQRGEAVSRGQVPQAHSAVLRSGGEQLWATASGGQAQHRLRVAFQQLHGGGGGEAEDANNALRSGDCQPRVAVPLAAQAARAQPAACSELLDGRLSARAL